MRGQLAVSSTKLASNPPLASLEIHENVSAWQQTQDSSQTATGAAHFLAMCRALAATVPADDCGHKRGTRQKSRWLGGRQLPLGI
eukprot:3323951-Rhodomonas_salina.1